MKIKINLIMKSLSIHFVFITFITLIFSMCGPAPKTKILLVTGGHNFDTAEFFNVFDSMQEYEFTRLAQPEANEFLGSEEMKKFSMVIFYDMWRNISDEQKKYYNDLAHRGVGFLFLHHSLVSYQEWDEFIKIIGGRYVQPKVVTDSSVLSNYRHDIILNVHIVDPGHPVTKGMKDFEILDEGYSNFRVEKDVTPLLTTKHPDSGELIGWTHKYRNSKVVYLMLGHDRNSYQNENFSLLIKNSIRFLSEK